MKSSVERLLGAIPDDKAASVNFRSIAKTLVTVEISSIWESLLSDLSKEGGRVVNFEGLLLSGSKRKRFIKLVGLGGLLTKYKTERFVKNRF